MTLKEWLNTYQGTGLVAEICSPDYTTDENMLAFHTAGLDAVVDGLLKYLHGKQIMDPDYVEDHNSGYNVVSYYIREKARYLGQVVAYFESEYNPIENYSQIEHETVKSEFDEVNQHGTDTKAQDEYQHGQHTDTDVYPTYTDQVTIPQYTDTVTTGQGGYDITQHTAKVQTQNTPPGNTRTQQVAPYEEDTYHNKEKVTDTPTQGTQTVERIASGSDGGDDKTSFSQKVDTNQHGQHTDQYIKGAHTDQHTFAQYSDIAHVGDTQDSYSHITDDREDNVTRDLTRSGNIGVQTAAQMMTLDEEFWWNFKPCTKMAREIAALLVEGVDAI